MIFVRIAMVNLLYYHKEIFPILRKYVKCEQTADLLDIRKGYTYNVDLKFQNCYFHTIF